MFFHQCIFAVTLCAWTIASAEGRPDRPPPLPGSSGRLPDLRSPSPDGDDDEGDDNFSNQPHDLRRLSPSRCPNQQLRDARGRIKSPKYPGRLPPNACFQWSIFVEDGETLTLTFRDFNISKRPDRSCTQGILEIGPVPHRKICLNSNRDYTPEVYESTHSLIWIKLATGPHGADESFVLKYITDRVPQPYCDPGLRQCASGKCLPSDWFCNGVPECSATDKSDESNCHRPAPLPTPIKLPQDRCGPGRFLCINRNQREVECFEDYQRCDGVVHCLNAEDEKRCDGRQLHCGGYTELQSGYITSPNFPQSYPIDKTCVWNIHVPAGRIIQVRFQVFDLSPENPMTGASDYVEFRDGRGRRAALLGRFTEQRRPSSVIETTGDWLYVKFKTDMIGGRDAIGFNFTHQIKGVCLSGQERCEDENDCYISHSEKCDGIWHCRRHGWDERGCANCDIDKYSCGRGRRCYTEQEHCNGRGSCFDNRDEKNCTPDQCNSGNGTYLCLNGRCIYESWVCDGTNDCEDDSDENDCVATPSIRVILAAVVGSLICGLLLVIALGCTLHMFAIRIQDQSAHYETPMSRLQAELMRRAAPPTYNEAMQTSVPFTEMLTHMRAAGRRISRGWRAPDIQATGPFNVAPLLAQTGTRISPTQPSSAPAENTEGTAVTAETATGADTEDDVTGLLARPGFDESSPDGEEEENETSLSVERESVSSESDVSLLELSFNTVSGSDSSFLETSNQSQVNTDDQALLLVNEVTNEVRA